MTVYEACELLDDKLGSGDDPITYRGKEITTNDLRYMDCVHEDANKVRIGYYAKKPGEGVRFIRNGTLFGMVKDRQRPYSLGYSLPKMRPARCPTCARPWKGVA